MVTDADESELIAGIRHGDRDAFKQLVDRHTSAMLYVARAHLRSHAEAEEVVQETWVALIKGIAGFEGRSTLRTWLLTVTSNISKKRAIRDRRMQDADTAFTAATVDPGRFHTTGAAGAGSWKEPPTAIPDSPENSLLGKELRAVIRREVDRLPDRQRAVVTLRDLLGYDATDVCELLEISAANQRVLLHRGRASIRRVVESYVADSDSAKRSP